MSKIRYMNDDDKKYFVDRLLHDKPARKFMYIIGGSENKWFNKLSDRWGAVFSIEKTGFIIISYNYTESIASINELFVVKEKRGNGFASELIDFAVQFAFDNWPQTRQIQSFTLKGSPAEKYKIKKGWKNYGTYKKFARGIDQTLWVYERPKTTSPTPSPNEKRTKGAK